MEPMNKIKTYSDLIKLNTFEERFKYLEIGGHIGIESFGFNRYLNQNFYRSQEWLQLRDQIILRDNGCDLGVDGYPINGRIMIHHINPITVEDVLDRNPDIFNPEYLICVSHATHNAIHYGDDSYTDRYKIVERKPNDTIPWR